MVKSTCELNSVVCCDKALKLVDKEYYSNVEKVCQFIMENSQTKPVVLLSGPSGSGKTTTALNIERYLDEKGYNTHTISLDSYFKSLTEEEREKDKLGKLNFESPTRIDKELLNEHIDKLFKGEEIKVPKFDFTLQERVENEYSDIIKRHPNEIVIFEGIHALNSSVIEFDSDRLINIYVSVRTRIQTKSGVVMHPSLIRLARRMIRDKLYRGRDVRSTFKYFYDVEAGSQNYVLPFKSRANFQIDTFIAYELNVYKQFIIKDLEKISFDNNIKLLMEVFNELDDLDSKKVSKQSLIREFIGGGHLKYK